MEEQQQAFTFASPISSSETYQDALDFDYQSWIDQSKINNCLSSQGDKLWMDGLAENHLLREEAYEMSLRDLSELSLSMAATEEEAVNNSVRSKSNKKPKPNKIPTMERVGLVIKLFMPRAAATGRLQDAISETGNEPSNSQSNRDTKTLPIKRYHDSTNRKSMVCYPLFSSRKYKVKRGDNFARKKLDAEDQA